MSYLIISISWENCYHLAYHPGDKFSVYVPLKVDNKKSVLTGIILKNMLHLLLILLYFFFIQYYLCKITHWLCCIFYSKLRFWIKKWNEMFNWRYVKNMSIHYVRILTANMNFVLKNVKLKAYHYIKCRIRAIYVVTSFIN